MAEDPTIIRDETGQVSSLRRNPETGDLYTPLPASESKSITQYYKATETNILNKYRSWTYNFSLGAVDATMMRKESAIPGSDISSSIAKYNVLNTAGKGTSGIGMGIGANAIAGQFIDEFNKASPGRFDMYIEDFSIESIIVGGKEQGSSQAHVMSFDIIEPYSMNGFIEALHAAAIGAGYPDFTKAHFALQVQFRGYPDNQSVKDSRPEIIPNTTRQWIITITQVNVEVTEKGTKYRCQATPSSQLGFGDVNILIADIQVKGNTVGELLQNFFKAINDQQEKAAMQIRKSKDCDKYEISCPKLPSTTEPQNVQGALLYPGSGPLGQNAYQNDFVKTKMNDDIKSPNVFSMPDPGSSKDTYTGAKSYTPSSADNKSGDPSTNKNIPDKGTASFKQGAQIHECIAAIIHDSKWFEEQLQGEKLSAAKAGSNSGMLPYFMVRVEVKLGDFDTIGNKFFYTYRYVLEPYLIHYTKIPGQEQGTFDASSIKSQLKRSYNYIYSGKNVDIMRFNLTFDTLFFAAYSATMGNKPAEVATAYATSPDNLVETQASKSAVAEKNQKTAGSSVPTTPFRPAPRQQNSSEITAGNQQVTPYYKLAQSMHEAMMEKADMITAEVEILGDPYYLVTGGMATQDTTLADKWMTKSGEAPINTTAVYVDFNFRNPVDVGPDGKMFFDSKVASFSGIYQVTECVSNFKNGLFTQKLNVLRVPGQLIGKESPTPAKNIITVPDSGDTVTKDSAAPSVNKQGLAANNLNLGSLLGSLSGINNIASSVRMSASGLASLPGVSSLASAASGLTAAGSALSGLTNGSLGSLGSLAATPSSIIGGASNLGSSLIGSAGAALGSITSNLSNPAAVLASNVVFKSASAGNAVVNAVVAKGKTLIDDNLAYNTSFRPSPDAEDV